MIADYVDIRRKPCAGCGGLFVPPGAGNGMCSDRCWVGARGRQEPQNAGLSRAAVELSVRAERRLVGGARAARIVNAPDEQAAVARHLADRPEALRLIGRAPRSPRPVVSRSEVCSGPDCPVCAECRALEARR